MDWDALAAKVQAVEAFNADWRHLRGALERDALWQQRHSLPEPSRSQLLDFEKRLAIPDEAIAQSEEGVLKFQESYSSVKPLLDAGMDPPSAMEEAYVGMSSGADLSLSSGATLRSLLIEIINSLRQAQDLPPLDGGLSPLN